MTTSNKTKANFNRDMAKYVEETGKMLTEKAHRPAEIFRRKIKCNTEKEIAVIIIRCLNVFSARHQKNIEVRW